MDVGSLHLTLQELEADRKAMREKFKRISDRVDHKINVLIPKYKPLAEQFLNSSDNYDNPIFSTVLVWIFDVDDLETAIDWCIKAIKRNIPTPVFIKRGWDSFCADTVLAWSEKQLDEGHSIEPYFSYIFEYVKDHWRLYEDATAKWFKFAGQLLLRDEDNQVKASSVGDVATLEQAKSLLIEAKKLHKNIGVNSILEKVASRINALKSGKNL